MSLLSIYKDILLWAEVWPLVIFLSICILTRQRNKELKLVILYLLITLLLSVPSNIISNINDIVPPKYRNNSIYYNAIAFLKVILLGSYIASLKPMRQYRYPIPLLIVFVFFSVIDFVFFESPAEAMGKHFFSAVSIVLLILCMTYFLTSIIDDEAEFNIRRPDFLICAGVAIFESINFFVFLFIYDLYTTDRKISLITRDISIYSYIISYLLFTIAVCRNSTWRWKVNTDKKLFSTNAC